MAVASGDDGSLWRDRGDENDADRRLAEMERDELEAENRCSECGDVLHQRDGEPVCAACRAEAIADLGE